MLEWKDFYHLPQIEPIIGQMAADRPGLVLVAGLDPRGLGPGVLKSAGVAMGGRILPSGQSTILRILMRQMLDTSPGSQAIVISGSETALRVPRSLKGRVHFAQVDPSQGYAAAVTRAAERRPDLLVVDRLDRNGAVAALEAARGGQRVLSLLDTVLWGAAVTRHLYALGVPRDLFAGLAWVVTVQRLETLCPLCRNPVPPDQAQLDSFQRRNPGIADSLLGDAFYYAPGCPRCHHTGRLGEVAAFDLFRADPEMLDLEEQPSLLSMETYLLGLAQAGYLSLDDVLRSEAARLWRTYCLFEASERAAVEARSSLGRRLAELEAANRVLQQRTEALISLEGIGQALIEATSLSELAGRLLRHARDLCGADRAILYYLRPQEGVSEVLAVHGWDGVPVGQEFNAVQVQGPEIEPIPYDRLPPGVVRDPADVTAEVLQAGLRVPLVAQDQQVGLMIVHTGQKSCFSPGEVALLQTFANQAALAIQRAGLTEALQEKIEQLEKAQAELVQKERLERELELARQLQQGVLPRTFPLVPGYTFAARNEPARWVGGDFYDIVLLDADHIGLVIGDVSDKGMPAALFMAQTHSLLRAEARRKGSPAAVLRTVHRLLQELSQTEMFVTVFYGIVEASTRRLTYARAGHDHPFVLRGGLILPLDGEGTVLGFPGMEDLHLTEERVDLLPGDRLVLYTDGLLDARASDGRTYGLARLKAALQLLGHLPVGSLCSDVFSKIDIFQGDAEQYDDMTLLVLDVE